MITDSKGTKKIRLNEQTKYSPFHFGMTPSKISIFSIITFVRFLPLFAQVPRLIVGKLLPTKSRSRDAKTAPPRLSSPLRFNQPFPPEETLRMRYPCHKTLPNLGSGYRSNS